MTDEGVAKLAAGSLQLSSLDLLDCTEVTDEGVAKLTAGCLQLSSLSLGCNSEVTDEGVGNLAAGCPQLSSLNLEICSGGFYATGRFPGQVGRDAPV